MDTRTFFTIMGTAPAAVTVVTTLDRRGRARGVTVAAVCSVSAEPPLLLVCIDLRSRTLPALREHAGFAVNFLRGDRAVLAERFASKVEDRFDGVEWCAGATGVPILYRDILAHAECRTVQEVEAGDHVVLIARVEGGGTPAPGSRPLTYFRHRYAPWPPGQVDDAAASEGSPVPTRTW